MKKINSIIIRGELNTFKNEKTGEISEMTKIIYLIPVERTDKVLGFVPLETYKKDNLLKEIEPYILKTVVLEIDEVPTKNGVKYVLKKINDKEI